MNLSALLRVYLCVKFLTAASTLAAVLALTSCAGVNPTAESSASPPVSPAASSSSAAVGTKSGPNASPLPSPAASPPRAAARTSSGPALTGFGATLAQWKAVHALDVSVPARTAYLPRVAGSADGEDTWQLVTAAGGRVNSYTLNVTASSLRSAEVRARQELPVDARVLWTRTVAGTCAQEQFESAMLAAALGDGQVSVEFDNATSGNVTPVTEELFGTYDAPTVAQAPAC